MSNETNTEKRYRCLVEGYGQLTPNEIYGENTKYTSWDGDWTVGWAVGLHPEDWELVAEPESAPSSLSQEAYDGLVDKFLNLYQGVVIPEKVNHYAKSSVASWAQQFKVTIPKQTEKWKLTHFKPKTI